jgi:hypothetical protein
MYKIHHREQHISKLNYEIAEVQWIHISRLKVYRKSLEFVIYLGFWIEVWILPIGIKEYKYQLDR